jgi:hypothetical protein
MKLFTSILFGAALLGGCAPRVATPSGTSALLEHEPPACEPAPVPGRSALVVEGFGGKNEEQLIVTERQLMTRCLRGAPARTATLGPVE